MIRLRALGQCVVEVGEHHVTPESDVLFALLLVLSSSAGHGVYRDDLLDLLWPDCPPTKARHRLRQALYQLKRLGAPLTTPKSVIAVRESDVEIDYVAYTENRQAVADSIYDPMSLDYLPRYAPTFSRRFANWVEGERDRVRGSIRRGLLHAMAESRERGDHASVIATARACLQLDPLNGDATFALAESLAVRGNRADALGVLDHYRLERHANDEEATRATVALRRRIVDLARKHSPNATTETPLTGRGPILAELNAWVASSGRGTRILSFVGEAGIGKTRLLKEGVRIATLRGVRCIEYRASAAGGERPLAGLFDLLPDLLSLPGAVGCSPEAFARLSGLAHGRDTERSIPEDRTDSVFRFATLRRSVLDLIEATLVEGEVIVALDDAHALDRPTLDILLDATRCVGGHRFALMIGMRPVGSAAGMLESRGDVRMVRVPRLDRVESRAIVQHQLNADLVTKRAAVVDWAVDLANGNPFFLVELGSHCRRDDANNALPESLQVALDQKLDALSSMSRLTIQACAILGDHSTLDRLEAMLALPPHTMASALSELEGAGLIAVRDARVVCRHELVAEATMRSITSALGAYLHRRCASLLDREIRTSPSASLAWDCASHWEAANEGPRALEITSVIVDRLLSLGLPESAADLCARAERHCRTPEQNAERLQRLARARRLLYEWDGVTAALEERRQLLRGVGSKSQRFSEDDIALFEAKWWRGFDATSFRRAARRVADQRAPVLHRLQMAVIALIVADNDSRLEEARRIAGIVDGLQPTNRGESLEKAKAQLIFNTAFGDLDLAVEIGAGCIEMERQRGDSAHLLRALRWGSIPLKWCNRTDAALGLLREAYDIASRVGLCVEMWNTAYYAESQALDCEDLSLATDWASVLLSHADHSHPTALGASFTDYVQARIAIMEGDLDRARRFLGRCREFRTTLPRLRGELFLLATEVLLRVRCHEPIPKHLLAKLRRLHLVSRSSGVHDFEAATLFCGLVHAGSEHDAQELHASYLVARRSRIEPHPTLVEAQRLLGR